MNAVTPRTTSTPRTLFWMETYRRTFGTHPVYPGPITYGGIRVCREAVENAVADMGVGELPKSDKLVPYLEDVKFTNGIIIPEFQFTPKSAKHAHDPQ